MTQDELKSKLHYDPDTGHFTWLVNGRNTTVGTRAGSVSKHLGYRFIKFDKAPLLEHRLAVLYMTGSWPENQVDHRNGLRADNRWSNLRDVSPSTNQENKRRAQQNNKLGLLGVSHWPNRGLKCYVAQLTVRGRRMHCSYHATPEEAHAAYIKAKRELHEGNTL